MNALKATIEEWRPTHHPHYEVSDLGRVRSHAPQGGNVRNGQPTYPKVPRVLKPGRASNGYWTVSFGRGHGSQCVHVLVAAAFLGPCPAGQEVRHKDDDRQNARADNLEYGTRGQNIQDMLQRGRNNPPRILSLQQVQRIRRVLDSSRRGPSRRARRGLLPEIAKAYGVSVGTIRSISIGRSWTHA
jgi:hypothetical protein